MAETLYDFISAGVPHKLLKASVIDAGLREFELAKGQTKVVNRETAARLQRQFSSIALAKRQVISRLNTLLPDAPCCFDDFLRSDLTGFDKAIG